jgi:hypothetical protein
LLFSFFSYHFLFTLLFMLSITIIPFLFSSLFFSYPSSLLPSLLSRIYAIADITAIANIASNPGTAGFDVGVGVGFFSVVGVAVAFGVVFTPGVAFRFGVTPGANVGVGVVLLPLLPPFLL